MILPNSIEVCSLSYYGKDAPPPSPAPLSREAEKAAFFRYKKRKNAKDRELLVRQYLCWAFGMAAKFKGPRLNFDEAISVANLGLVEALNGFDPARGFRFTTYAAFTLRRKLIEAIVSTYPVKVSDHLRKTLRALSLTPEEQARELAQFEEPRTLEEFFERLGESVEIDLGHLHDRPEDAPFCPAPGGNPADELQHEDLTEELKAALASLEPLERAVVLARHYQEPPESFDSIGRRLHVSKNRAREAGGMAIVRLRRFFKKDI
jgi:RNA polymerase sigma factor (sigma-70 family)